MTDEMSVHAMMWGASPPRPRLVAYALLCGALCPQALDWLRILSFCNPLRGASPPRLRLGGPKPGSPKPPPANDAVPGLLQRPMPLLYRDSYVMAACSTLSIGMRAKRSPHDSIYLESRGSARVPSGWRECRGRGRPLPPATQASRV